MQPTIGRTVTNVIRMSLCGMMLALPGFLGSAMGGEADGYRSIFDGKTLDGWDGNSKFWRVEEGTITGETSKDNPTSGNTFIIWRGGQVANFELKLQYRIIPKNDKNFGNSGIQYRSFELPDKKWVVGGYQADCEAGDTYSGIVYGEKFRGILCNRGQKTILERLAGGKFSVRVVGKIGDSKQIQSKIKKEDWNDYHITANGNHFVHRINGVLTADCTDEDKKMRRASGILALQLHAGPPMKVQFRNIRLKELKSGSQSKLKSKSKLESAATDSKDGTKRVAFIAGTKSHGYGAHEHRAGCMVLAKALNESGLPVSAEVYTGGWPTDASVLNHVDAIVIYCDGGVRHPFNKHLSEIDRLMKKGVGLVCIHYAVEVPKGDSGSRFLDWTGGYFEANWSVNPHWDAKYKSFPAHEITRGVMPFTINDEWYYHMRFREKMENITPILSALPTAETLKRKDGPHSNNPYVRAAVLERKEQQHMAWAMERADGGRGFGFTGGHFHWNWGNNSFRKLVLNAICWTAHVNVPKNGVSSKPLTVADLQANQDYDLPGSFNPGRITQMLKQWNSK